MGGLTGPFKGARPNVLGGKVLMNVRCSTCPATAAIQLLPTAVAHARCRPPPLCQVLSTQNAAQDLREKAGIPEDLAATIKQQWNTREGKQFHLNSHQPVQNTAMYLGRLVASLMRIDTHCNPPAAPASRASQSAH